MSYESRANAPVSAGTSSRLRARPLNEQRYLVQQRRSAYLAVRATCARLPLALRRSVDPRRHPYAVLALVGAALAGTGLMVVALHARPASRGRWRSMLEGITQHLGSFVRSALSVSISAVVTRLLFGSADSLNSATRSGELPAAADQGA